MKPAEAAKEIRARLKATFPHTKFRVTSESGDVSDVSVEWSGSPTQSEMNAAILEMPAETFASLHSEKWFGRTPARRRGHEEART